MRDKTKFHSSTTRRELLRAGAVLATGCSIFSARKIFAQAAFAGKPLLNPESLRRLSAGPPGESYRALLREAARDPMAFLELHFTLTNNQRADLLELFGQAGSIQKPGSLTSSPSSPKVSDSEQRRNQQHDMLQKQKQLQDLEQKLKDAADNNWQAIVNCGGGGSSATKHMTFFVTGGNSKPTPAPTPPPPRARTSQRAAPGAGSSEREQFTGTLNITVWGF